MMRSFAELRTSGLLWLINRTVFHPRGFALAFHVDDQTGACAGWSLRTTAMTEPFTFSEAEDDAGYLAAEATLADAAALTAAREAQAGLTTIDEDRCGYVYLDGSLCRARRPIHKRVNAIIPEWAERHDFMTAAAAQPRSEIPAATPRLDTVMKG